MEPACMASTVQPSKKNSYSILEKDIKKKY